jgi:5-methylcytosine-specific restriction enzyme A
MPPIDVGALAAELGALFGLDIVPSEVRMEGGNWPALRPSHPEEPNGFAILLSRTPRSVLAQFQADRFSARLLGTMADADDEAKQLCLMQMVTAQNEGLMVSVVLDGNPVGSPEQLLSNWKRIDLECSARLTVRMDAPDTTVLRVAQTCMGMVLALLPLGEEHIDQEPGLPEGARIVVTVNRYERSAVNRAMCIEHFGNCCNACGLSFEHMYGRLGKNFIEVHHLTPLSQMGDNYRVNPRVDLIPLCSNCHAMVHRSEPPLSVENLRSRIADDQLKRIARAKDDALHIE